MSVVDRAVAVVQKNRQLVVENIALPELQPHQVYVSVEWAAFNPTDRLAFDVDAFGDGAVLGCDFAGTVTQAHPNVSRLQVGERIAALVWGDEFSHGSHGLCVPDHGLALVGEMKGVGAYSSYCIADERISFKVPNTVEGPKTSAVPLAANTAYLALFSEDCLGLSRDASTTKPPVLIWGGSSVVGYFAIQLAKLHGYPVATTCSPRNFDYVKNAGATYVFDYNDADVVAKLQTAVLALSHVFDTIGNASSSVTAATALNGRPGVLCTVRPGKANTEEVPKNTKVTDVFVFTAFPTAHTYRGLVHWPVSRPNHLVSAELYQRLPGMLESNALKPPPVKLLGRLSPQLVNEAMQLNREGKISAEKLCFDVSSAFGEQSV